MNKIDYGVIDNFIPSDAFDELKTFLLSSGERGKGKQNDSEKLPWYHTPAGYAVNRDFKKPDSTRNWRLFYLTHMIYSDTITSPYYERILSHCCEQLDIKSLIRVKINMYPNTEKIYEHGMHFDYHFPHKGAILSINTCDGYTKFEDGTKIDSVANRLLLFDASKLHSSTTTTNQPVRINININFF